MNPAAAPELTGVARFVLCAAGLFFLWALGLGVWKWRQMATRPQHLAHPYVDMAHRAALLYSFAALLIAVFAQLSAFGPVVNAIAAFVPLFFFAAAIAIYCVHGYREDTDNQIRDAIPGSGFFMALLIAGEIGGFAVLFAGFCLGQLR